MQKSYVYFNALNTAVTLTSVWSIRAAGFTVDTNSISRHFPLVLLKNQRSDK
jgi:hypothetical protein